MSAAPVTVKRRRGPRPAAGVTRRRLVTLKLTDDEHGAVAARVAQERAAGTVTTVATWIRDRALEALSRG